MPKTSKKQPATAAAATPSNPDPQPATSPSEGTASAPAKKRPAAKSTARKKATKSSAPKTAARKKTAKTAPAPETQYEPSDSEIRLRAYFIAERRIQMSLEGDSALDWIEARRQLIEEARGSAAS